MRLYGQFYNKAGNVIDVEIVTNGDTAQAVEIGSGGIYFDADDCIEISSTTSDTTDVRQANEASIKLVTDRYLPDLYVADPHTATVTIAIDGAVLYAGYLQPQAYSQDFRSCADSLELSCVDGLGVLEYANYANIGSHGISYAAVKATASQRTFAEIIKDMLGTQNVYFDGSRALSGTSGRYSIFSELSVSELLFLDEDEDKVWTQSDVLDALLRYLNLHIKQIGDSYYIYDWASVKGSGVIAWQSIYSTSSMTSARKTVAISLDNAADDATRISIGKVYNVVSVKCDISDADKLIENPLSSDSLTYPFGNKQKVLTEYISEGEGSTAIWAMYAMTHGQTHDYSEAKTVDWYAWAHGAKSWRFYKDGTATDLVEDLCGSGHKQTDLPDWLTKNIGAALISYGSVEHKVKNNDNSLVSKISMTDYMVVSVNGNEDDTESGCRPNAADLVANAPVAEYTGTTSAGVFSPADDKTTNYVVISGQIALAPIQKDTAAYATMVATTDKSKFYTLCTDGGTVPSRNNGDGRYYTRCWFDAKTPFDTPEERTGASLMPYSDECGQLYEFNYSAIGDGTDTISKVSVLACMLVIGDKVAIETGTDGQVSDFSWQTYKPREQCASDDEYYQQCIFIGFNPKIGDKLIGTDFDIQNNISYTMGLDVEGIAIPIKRSDAISGRVSFKILGPVNTLWDNITRRHPTWFRHTKWSSTSVPLLSHVSAIFLKKLEVQIYSDNGLITVGKSNSDIIYMSDTDETFSNKKEVTFDISSALSTEECAALGVSQKIALSTAILTKDKSGLLNVYDCATGEQAKPEQLYVDAYYRELHKPRVEMEQCLQMAAVIPWAHYRHPALGKEFFVQSEDINVADGTSTLTLKEIDND